MKSVDEQIRESLNEIIGQDMGDQLIQDVESRAKFLRDIIMDSAPEDYVEKLGEELEKIPMTSESPYNAMIVGRIFSMVLSLLIMTLHHIKSDYKIDGMTLLALLYRITAQIQCFDKLKITDAGLMLCYSMRWLEEIPTEILQAIKLTVETAVVKKED